MTGFLLGITLTDGFLKKKFVLTTVSKKLAHQVTAILRERRGFDPHVSIQNRERFGWNDLYSVYLGKDESALFKQQLNITLRELGTDVSFDALKRYEKENGPAEI